MLFTTLLFSVSLVVAAPVNVLRRGHHSSSTDFATRTSPMPEATSDISSDFTSTFTSSIPEASTNPDSSTMSDTTSDMPTISESGSMSTTGTATSATPSGSGGPVAGGDLGALFPVPGALKQWTTLEKAPAAILRPLSDDTFRPEKVDGSTTHAYVNAPDGKMSMKAHYPAGSFNPSHQPVGGISFYAPGPVEVDLSTAKEATFGYSVYFPADFDWVKGGKLPGLYGGDTAEGAVSCSGGRKDDTCFSVRLMWRAAGAGEFYVYLPPDFPENQKMCGQPNNDCNDEYGTSIGRGNFHFVAGQRVIVSERVKLNDPGQANGEIEMWFNGQSVIQASGLKFSGTDAGRIRGIQMQTFFGGSDDTWATKKDVDVFFSDFSAAIITTI